jgi:hypothetical protein
MKEIQMLYPRMTRIATFLAVVGLLVHVPAIAEEADDREVTPDSPAVAKDVGIPACLAKLQLSEEQEKQVKEIINDYDQDLTMVWKQFSVRYMDTIRTEALLLTAIEDKFTDAQREQVRKERRKTAHHQKSLESTAVKPNQATSKPASAVEEEIAIVGVALSPQQQVAADALQEKYLSQLRSLNRDIEGLHMRLVSLEADKIVEIEKVLTKDQLLQLRKIRQDYPTESKVAVRDQRERPTTE